MNKIMTNKECWLTILTIWATSLALAATITWLTLLACKIVIK